jgi:hypothetical protein
MKVAAAEEDVELRTDIPNSHLLPSLHVFAYRNNQRLLNNPIMTKVNATSETILQ